MQKRAVEEVSHWWDKVLAFFTTSINWIAGIILSLIGISSLFISAYFKNIHNNYTEFTFYKWDSIIINILGVIVLFCIFYIAYRIVKKIPLKVLLVFVLVIFMTLQVIWINVIKFPPRSDQAQVIEAAQDFRKGNYNLLERGSYLDLYPYQLGIVYAIEGALNILGENNIVGLQYVNVIACGICILCLYFICKKLFKQENINRILLLLCLTFLPLILMTTFVYGTLVGLAFALLALVFLLQYFQTDKIRYAVLSAISVSLAIILKSNFTIFLVAIIIILIIHTIQKKNIKALATLAGFLVIIFIFSQLVGLYTKWRTGFETKDRGVPMISFFTMGMQEGDLAPGWFNNSTAICYFNNGYDVSKTNEESKETLKQRLHYFIKNPMYTTKFFGQKLGSTWLNPTFQSIWINVPGQPLDSNPTYKDYIESNRIIISFFDGKLNKIITYYFDFYQILIFIGAGVYVIYNRKKMGYQQFIIALIFLGGFAYHLMSETKALYVIPYYFMLMVYAAAQLYQIFEWLDKKSIFKSKVKELSEEAKEGEK